MKRIKYLFLFLLLIPIYINASEYLNYSDSYSKAENYIKKGNYYVTYQRYIIPTDESHFIGRDEYELTKGSKGISYLFDGVEFWLTKESSNYYIVDYKGLVKSANEMSKYNARDVEYVNPSNDIKVRGSGTYHNPWTFEPMYEVKVITDNKFGYIESDGNQYSTLSKYIVKGNEARFSVSAKDKYMYITNDCGARYSNGNLIIDNVRRNITCKVVFGSGRYKITLTDGNPNIIYLKYNDNYYSDLNYMHVLTKIEKPTKVGYEFLGYKYNDLTIIDQDGNINRSTVNAITGDVTLEPEWKRNAITITFNTNNLPGTFSFTSREYPIGEAYGTLPTWNYSPSCGEYKFNGWYTSLNGGDLVTEDTIMNYTTNTTLYAHKAINGRQYYSCIYGGSYNSSTNECTINKPFTGKNYRVCNHETGHWDGYPGGTNQECNASGNPVDVPLGTVPSSNYTKEFYGCEQLSEPCSGDSVKEITCYAACVWTYDAEPVWSGC